MQTNNKHTESESESESKSKSKKAKTTPQVSGEVFIQTFDPRVEIRIDSSGHRWQAYLGSEYLLYSAYQNTGAASKERELSESIALLVK
jgi:hypothetical protein